MKKYLGLILAMMIVSIGQAAAETVYRFEDTWKDWPGAEYETNIGDELGTPKIDYMNVISDGGNLKAVQIAIHDSQNRWQEFNSLFINSYAANGGADDPQDWNFFVHDDRGTINNHGFSGIPGNGIYSVNETFNYTLATGSGVRTGNPNGIHKDDLVKLSDGSHWQTTGQDSLGRYLWTYSFDSISIDLSQGFAVAFAPWCANDVIGGEMNPVPEPATMALLGIGLLGLAGVARKRISG